MERRGSGFSVTGAVEIEGDAIETSRLMAIAFYSMMIFANYLVGRDYLLDGSITTR